MYNNVVNSYIEEKYKDKIKQRLKVLDHAHKFGIKSAIDAYDVSERTIKYWRARLRKGKGYVPALAPKSTRPIHTRVPKTQEYIVAYIKEIKGSRPKIGKEKIAVLIQERFGITISPTTVYRIINRLIKQGRLKKRIKVSYYGKTGKIIERKASKTKHKLRRKGYIPKHRGDVIQIDTVVIHALNKKYYILTAIDIFNRISYAQAYTSHSSKTAKEFLISLAQWFGYRINHVQTDNGSEFCKYFDEACTQLGVTHFWNHVRSPKENAFIERFNRTIQEEWLVNHMHLFNIGIINQINDSMKQYIDWYNEERPHWSLSFKAPRVYDKEIS